jgi:hypothetical protein
LLLAWCLAAHPSGGVTQDEPLGRGAAFGVLEPGPTVLILPGMSLRSRPDPRAEALVIVEAEVELPILERQGQWVRTHYDDWTGWVAPDGEPEEVELEPARTSRLVIDTSVSERAARVANARSLLASENAAATSVGPWRLYTDVRDQGLLGGLDRVAGRLPQAYEERFGLQPDATESKVVVLYASEADYRRFTEEFTDLGDLDGGGHADQAMAALFAGSMSRDRVQAILVHELTHLLNRGPFAESPRSWLEEGLANDLGLARIDGDGGIQPGTLGGETTLSRQRSASRVIVDSVRTGGQALWTRLLRDWRRNRAQLLPLAQLLDLEWSEFIDDSHRESNYSQSTFFVRYLLDDSGAETASAFRGFLRAVAAGGDSGSAALASALGTSVDDLQERYERWLTRLAVQSR